jgi:hypothetical protein
MPPSYRKKFPQGLWNVENFIVENLGQKLLPHGLWKTNHLSTEEAEQKSVAPQRKFELST